MVVLVNTSQEPNLIDFYNLKDADMHSYVASKVFKELEGLGLDEIKTNHKEERSLAKQGGFSIVFGGTGFTVARNLNIPLEKGIEFETGYFEAFPELKAFFDTMLELTLTNGYITLDFKTNSQLNILGVDKLKESLKYYSFDNKAFWNTYKEEKKKNSKEFLKLKDQVSKYFKLISKIKRNSQNYIIQGSSASIMKIAMILFYNWLIKEDLLFKVLISNVVHDKICRG